MIYHTSPEKIEKIVYGTFGANIFFSDEIYAMGEYHFVYSIEDENLEFLTGSHLYYNINESEIQDFIDIIASVCEVDHEEAFEILCDRQNFESDDYSVGYRIQEVQGDLAHHLGYFGFQTKDEQGTVYIVHLTEEKLKSFNEEEV